MSGRSQSASIRSRVALAAAVCASLAAAAPDARAADGGWNANPGDGAWSNPANWLGGVPRVAGDTATFPTTVKTSPEVTVDGPFALASLTFDTTHSYTLSGIDPLTVSRLNTLNGSI